MSTYIYRSSPGPGCPHRTLFVFSRASLGILALMLWLFASAALAAPVHPPLPGLSLDGKNKTVAPKEFNKACGAAVDSKGDVYVASAGNSTVDVFDSEHNYLTSISNANEPCGLAVDSQGNLYASEAKTGDVVQYKPNAYPFSGTPTYTAPTTIDASGNAEGISVDPRDDRLYVAGGDRIDTYDSKGNPGTSEISDEVQRVVPFNATGGTYRLTFEGQTTKPIPYEASHAVVQTELRALSTIGAGNVSVAEGSPIFEGRDHIITFEGTLAQTGVPQITCDASGLVGGSPGCSATTNADGFSGHIGKDLLASYTGVAAYTYASGDLYLLAADAATNQLKVFSGAGIKTLKLRRTISGVDQDGDPKTPDQTLGFGSAGAYLAVDPGNGNPGTKKCVAIAEQACTTGHFLIYDDAHEAVDEFEANGRYLTQISKAQLTEADPGFADAQPTAIAVDRSGGAKDGTVYVSAGVGPGAKLLAFGPLAAPGRPPLPAPLSHVLESAQAVATDSAGDVYVAAAIKISVYDPAGAKLTEFEDAELGINQDLAVDSTGKLYVLEKGKQVTYYTPAVYPPVSATTYTRHEPPCATLGSFSRHKIGEMESIGINPTNGHVFVSAREQNQIIELDSAANGCTTLNPDFAASLLNGIPREIAAYGANGNVYISGNNQTIVELNPGGTEILARISAAGSPKGQFGGGNPGSIAVDQSNGHVLVFNNTRGVAEEFDASGAFVAQFGEFTTAFAGPSRIAIDNSGGPTDGNVFVAYDDPAPETFDLTAFGPLAYGEPPIAVTGTASGLGGGNATLNGTVDPRGFDLTECKFEYLTDAKYQENLEAEDPAFENAEEEACIPAEIGKGAKPVPVHADLSGLDPEGRYRFRLLAANKYGSSKGKAGLFGVPLLTTKPALPIAYTEATLRAEIDPSALVTKYRFEYVSDAQYLEDSEEYGQGTQTTPVAELPPGEGPVAIEAPLTGLAEATTYHFRLLAENEAGAVQGPDQTLETLQRAEPPQGCANAEFRTGRSANLPDCRAYELVTPADTRGSYPYAADTGNTPGRGFNNWLVTPRGEGAGESLAYFVDTTLPGFDGTGRLDGYRAQRVTDDGPHPKEGWKSELFGPSYQQAGGSTPDQHGIAADQRYSFWEVKFLEAFEGTLPKGVYLRTPTGFEPVGQGSIGTDPEAESRYVSGGGDHVIFASKEHLEAEAAPAGTVAIYDRAAGSKTSQVVSLKPGNASFATGENATYVTSTEDGSAVVFRVGGLLYLRRADQTTEIAEAPNTFAGISADGKRVFYAGAVLAPQATQPADLFACDVEAGACVGSEPPGQIEIAKDSIFVNVSADGSHVYFTSKEVLDQAAEGTPGANNLYLWDGAGTRFVALLDPKDLVSFEAGGIEGLINLRRWAEVIGPPGATNGRGYSPTRSTPNGEVLVFESHAPLTSYDNTEASAGACGDPKQAGDRCVEIYRYDAAAALGERLSCVSCDPSGAPPSADARLETLGFGKVVHNTTLIANLSDDGGAVFFESRDRLLPEDANSVQDVYEWKAPGAGCKRVAGCLALISSGQSEQNSFLYSVSPNGNDVFFTTLEKLVGADVTGSPSIYDARREGGIPDPPAAAPCQGDACQGQGSPPPALPSPASTGSGDGNIPKEGPSACRKGKHRVKGRCVKKHHKPGRRHKRSQHRANHKRRAAR